MSATGPAGRASAGGADVADPGDADGAGAEPEIRRWDDEPPRSGHPLLSLAVVLVLIAVGVAAVDAIGDLTQTRADHVPRGSRSEIVLDIDTNAYKQTLDDAAEALWAACAGSTNRRLVEEPGIVAAGGDEVRFQVEPALGRNARRKLVGCLEDTTIDRVLADVRSVTLVLPA